MSVTIRLQNLPLSANAANIREFFHGLYIPDGGVNIVGGEDGDAFIVFATDEDARKAMLLSGQLINNVPVRLLLSSKTEMQALIADAQNRVQRPVETTQPSNEKRSYTFYDPVNNVHEPPAPKVRVIDYSEPADSFSGMSHIKSYEPPRPSEFSYRNAAPANLEKKFQPDVYGRRDLPVEHNEDYLIPLRDEDLSLRRLGNAYEEPHYDNSRFREDYARQHETARPRDKDYMNRFDRDHEMPIHQEPELNSRLKDDFRRDLNADFDANYTFSDQEFSRRPLPYQDRSFNHVPYEDFKRQSYQDQEISNSRYPNINRDFPSEMRRPYQDEPLYNQRNIFRQKELLNHYSDYYDDESRVERYPKRSIMDERLDRISRNDYGSDKYGNGRIEYDGRRDRIKAPLRGISPKSGSVSFGIKACLPTFLIKHKTIFDIFKGISIVSKTGIKIEYDEDKRLTGYVYIEFTNDSEAYRALKQNNRTYQGVSLTVEKCTIEEFRCVKDETNKVVYNCKTPLFKRSPYYRDHCLEIYNISTQTTREDLEKHLDVKLDPKKVNFVESEGRICCIMHGIDEQSMLKILSYDNDTLNGHNMRILAISQPQYRKLINVGKKMEKLSPIEPLKPHVAAQRYVDDSKNTMKCAKLDKLRPGTTASTLCSLFSPTIIPLSNIVVSGTEAIVDFVSSNTCQKIINEIKNRSNFSFTINPITSVAYNTIKSNFANRQQKALPFSSQSNAMKAESKPLNNKTNGLKDEQSDSDQKVNNPVKVKLRRLPTYIGHSQLSNFLKSFQPPVVSIQMCYTNNRHNGEAVIALKDGDTAKQFKNEFDGAKFKTNTLEVLFMDNSGSKH